MERNLEFNVSISIENEINFWKFCEKKTIMEFKAFLRDVTRMWNHTRTGNERQSALRIRTLHSFGCRANQLGCGFWCIQQHTYQRWQHIPPPHRQPACSMGQKQKTKLLIKTHLQLLSP